MSMTFAETDVFDGRRLPPLEATFVTGPSEDTCTSVPARGLSALVASSRSSLRRSRSFAGYVPHALRGIRRIAAWSFRDRRRRHVGSADLTASSSSSVSSTNTHAVATSRAHRRPRTIDMGEALNTPPEPCAKEPFEEDDAQASALRPDIVFPDTPPSTPTSRFNTSLISSSSDSCLRTREAFSTEYPTRWPTPPPSPAPLAPVIFGLSPCSPGIVGPTLSPMRVVPVHSRSGCRPNLEINEYSSSGSVSSQPFYVFISPPPSTTLIATPCDHNCESSSEAEYFATVTSSDANTSGQNDEVCCSHHPSRILGSGAGADSGPVRASMGPVVTDRCMQAGTHPNQTEPPRVRGASGYAPCGQACIAGLWQLRPPLVGLSRLPVEECTTACASQCLSLVTALPLASAQTSSPPVMSTEAHSVANARAPYINDATTMMIRNLPKNVSQQMLLQELNQTGFKGLYDFCYMPRCFSSGRNHGIAFVNFTSSDIAIDFVFAWGGQRRFGASVADQSLNISQADVQGLKANSEKWSSQRFRRVRNPDFLPFVAPGCERNSTEQGNADDNDVAVLEGKDSFQPNSFGQRTKRTRRGCRGSRGGDGARSCVAQPCFPVRTTPAGARLPPVVREVVSKRGSCAQIRSGGA